MIVGVILAGGSSQRFNNSVRKQFIEVDGIPLIHHTVGHFITTRLINKIILVLPEGTEKFTAVTTITGGRNRLESLSNALNMCNDDDLIVTHDGNRPGTTGDLIDDQILDFLNKESIYKFSVNTLPCTDTIIGRDLKLRNRSDIWITQTPSIFRCDLGKKLINNISKCDPNTNCLWEAFLQLEDPSRLLLHRGNPISYKLTYDYEIDLIRSIING